MCKGGCLHVSISEGSSVWAILVDIWAKWQESTVSACAALTRCCSQKQLV